MRSRRLPWVPLGLALRASGLDHGMVTEHRFHDVRRWRLDLAWPSQKLGVELDGGIWVGGRHTRSTGFSRDLEKLNAATLLGWRVLRYTPDMVRSGKALVEIREALALHA